MGFWRDAGRDGACWTVAMSHFARYQVWRAADRQWYFRLRARNGEIVHGSEGYKTRAGALRGIGACRRAASEATVQELKP